MFVFLLTIIKRNIPSSGFIIESKISAEWQSKMAMATSQVCMGNVQVTGFSTTYALKCFTTTFWMGSNP